MEEPNYMQSAPRQGGYCKIKTTFVLRLFPDTKLAKWWLTPEHHYLLISLTRAETIRSTIPYPKMREINEQTIRAWDIFALVPLSEE